ncbi:DHA2 family efflux MFS transporter permease subunit [Actinophytocola sediminis]
MDATARRTGLVLAFGGLLVIVDTIATIVALPAIVTDLDTTLPRGAWTTTAYVLGVITVIPLTSWLPGRFGDRRVYVTGLVVFTLAGFAAGASPTIETLIALRVLQGVGGGVLNPIGTVIALRSVPHDRRGAVMSLLGLPLLIGPVLGPPLIGLLVDAGSWRWLFWINLPLGVLALVLCRRFLPPSHHGAARPMDWLGLVLVTPGCVGLVLACVSIGDAGRPTVTTGVAVLGGVGLLALFVRRCLRVAHPLIGIGLLRRRGIAVPAVILGCFTAGYFGASTILPAFVQGVRGDPVSVAGLLAVPTGLAVGLTVQIATRLVDRVNPRRVILVGTATAFTGAVALGVALSVDMPYPVIGAVSVLVGIGSGATLMPTMVTASRGLDGADLTAAAPLLFLIQQLGTALGTALVASTITLLTPTGLSGLAAMVTLDPDRRADLADRLAPAVGLSYLTPATLMLAALLAAAWGLRVVRWRRPSRTSLGVQSREDVQDNTRQRGGQHEDRSDQRGRH